MEFESLAKRIEADTKYRLFMNIENFIHTLPENCRIAHMAIEETYALIIYERPLAY